MRVRSCGEHSHLCSCGIPTQTQESPLTGVAESTTRGRHGFTNLHIGRANGHSPCSEWQQALHTVQLTFLIPYSHLPEGWALGCCSTQEEEGFPWMVCSAAQREGHLLQWTKSMQMQIISREHCRSLPHYGNENFCNALCNALGIVAQSVSLWWLESF